MKTEVPFEMTAAQMIAHAQKGGWIQEYRDGYSWKLAWDPVRELLFAGGSSIEKVALYPCRPCDCQQCKENA